jgi:hypothetical protein
VRFDTPIEVAINGRRHSGAILKPAS